MHTLEFHPNFTHTQPAFEQPRIQPSTKFGKPSARSESLMSKTRSIILTFSFSHHRLVVIFSYRPFVDLLCRLMQTRRKVVTYKGRNRRKREKDDDPDPAPTSPLSELDKDETTLSEMSRRIGKRSRLLAAPSALDLPAFTDTKNDSAPARSSKRSRVENAAAVTSGPLSTVFDAKLHANSFQTPVTSVLPLRKRASSELFDRGSASSLFLVPLTKLTFHSGFKENLVTSQPHIDLASPFNSQPNSRNASPTKSQPKPKPTKRSRAKSRTLSAHLPENHDFATTATDAPPSPDRKKAKTLHHGRNPSLPSFAVDDSPDWLNYAEAKPRKPVRGNGRRNVRGSSRSTFSVSSSGSQPRPQVLPIHHTSFSLEVPLAFSTPPANRYFDSSPQDSVDWGKRSLIRRFLDADAEDEDVEMADAEPSTPDSASRAPNITKTRLQTVHISRDSLFSSMEISGSGSASTITGAPVHVSGDQTVGDKSPGSTMLASVMSLTRTLDPTDNIKFPNLCQTSEQTCGATGEFDRMLGDDGVSNTLAGSQLGNKSTRNRSPGSCLDDLEALGARVSEMNLEGFARSILTCRTPTY